MDTLKRHYVWKSLSPVLFVFLTLQQLQLNIVIICTWSVLCPEVSVNILRSTLLSDNSCSLTIFDYNLKEFSWLSSCLWHILGTRSWNIHHISLLFCHTDERTWCQLNCGHRQMSTDTVNTADHVALLFTDGKWKAHKLSLQLGPNSWILHNTNSILQF